MNVVMSSEGRFVEVQGTGEHGHVRARRAKRTARSRHQGDHGVERGAAGGPPTHNRAGLMTIATPLLVATRSAGKLRELRPLFADHGVAIVSLGEQGVEERPEEDDLEVFDTYEENALAKARYFARRTGLPVVADDSGLEVLGLGGRPGVRSKRWSCRPDLSGQALDDANNAMLLAAVAGLADRRARYVCTAVYCDDRTQVVRRGETDGRIVDLPTGDGGFGYDPYFVSDELQLPFGAIETLRTRLGSAIGRARSNVSLRRCVDRIFRGGYIPRL